VGYGASVGVMARTDDSARSRLVGSGRAPLNDLVSLGDRVWLVIADLNELRAAAAQRQPELLVMLVPELRFVLAARHHRRLGVTRCG